MLSSTELYAPIETGDYAFAVGRYGKSVHIENTGGRYELVFNYNEELLKQVKMLDGKKYHGYDEHNPRKIWSCKVSARNNFRLRRLMGENVYELYDLEPNAVNFERPLFSAQKEMVAHGLTHKRCIIAGEMGTGKTLSAIEIMERSGKSDWWWIGPKSALAAVEVDMRKWKCRIKPRFMTYNKFTTHVTSGDADIPDGIIFDESSKLKTPNSQRTQAAFAAANAVMEHDGYLILMSGTPAPKSPVDWWSQTEICCPGYLIEPNANMMKYTMAYITESEGIAGTTFPKLIGWKDTEKRCAVCGEFENTLNHFYDDPENVDAIKKAIIDNKKDTTKTQKQQSDRDFELRMMLKRAENTKMGFLDGGPNVMHKFEPGVNEVARLYRRLKGLAVVIFKKDCLDLPDKFYRQIDCKPSEEMLLASKSIKKIETRGVTALMKLRQISDGFLYTKEKSGSRECPVCEGEKTISYWWHPDMMSHVPEHTEGAEFRENEICPECAGTGKIDLFEDVTNEIKSPKEDVLKDLLDEYSEVGRLVIFAAFTATIDKIVNVVKEAGWSTVRVDGRGWDTDLDLKENADILEYFQENSGDRKVAFILHPESGGMGLTLTASPAAIFYSNDFKAENRMQAEDRIHRIGMDESRGATIIDLFCLETDRMIYENLLKKKDLQRITMGDIPDEPIERD